MLELAQKYLDIILPSLSRDLPTLLLFTVAIFLYGVLIYHFYRFVAARDIFGFNLLPFRRGSKRGSGVRLFNFLMALIEYGLILPIIVFIWFAGFSVLLFLMAKGLAMGQILLIAITLVSAIRIAAYYNEDLSRDIAKLLPFVLLGIAIVDPSFFSIPLIQERAASISVFVGMIAAFVVFAILLEWALRILLAIKRAFFGFSRKDLEKAEQLLSEKEEALAKREARKRSEDNDDIAVE